MTLSLASERPGTTPFAFQAAQNTSFAQVYCALQKEARCIVPPRKLLNLRAIPTVAPYLALFEFKSASEIVVRLAGTGFVMRTGHDNTGEDALAILPDHLREWTRAHFQRIVRTPCASACVAWEHYGRALISTEVLALPFSRTDGEVAIIAAASIPHEQPSYLPHEDAMRIGRFEKVNYLDIGAGTGEPRAAKAS